MKKLLLLVSLISLFFSVTYSQSVVCRREFISGFHQEHAIGASVCGGLTHSMADTKIYMMVRDGQLYAQSNFVNVGAEFPSKLATSDNMDSFETLAMNLFFTEQPTSSEYEHMVSILKQKVDVIIDPSFFNSSKFSGMDIDVIHHLKIYGPNSKVYDGLKLIESDGSVQYCLHYDQQFSIRIKDQNLGFIFSSLDKTSSDFDRLKIVNLLSNSATERELQANFANNAIPFDFSSKEQFKSALLSNTNGQTIILGHIEDGDFVTINNAGEEIFRMPVDEIEAFRKEHHLAILLAGCNSAKEGAVSGVANKFNSIDFLRGLKSAAHAKNNKEFLDGMGSESLHFIIGDSFFSRESAALQNTSDALVVDIRRTRGTGGGGGNGGGTGVHVGPSVGTLVFLGMDDIGMNVMGGGDTTSLQGDLGNGRIDNADLLFGPAEPEKEDNNWIWWVLGGFVVVLLIVFGRSIKS